MHNFSLAFIFKKGSALMPPNVEFHDVPCEDITLAGRNFETENVLTEDPDDVAVTGAFSLWIPPKKRCDANPPI